MKIFLIAAAVLLVIRMARGRSPAPAVVAAPSRLLPVLAAAAAVMGVAWWEATHPAPRVITVPAPAPQPAVTVTAPPPAAAPHLAAPHFTFLDHLTGTDWVLIVLIGAVATYALVRPLLGRSS